MSQTNVAELVVASLADIGVKHLFGIPGDAINGLIDALRRESRVRFIQVRHEEAGAFAASATAKLTGRLAACTGTAGPGALHLLNGLYDAHKDRAPVLAITGQVETDELGHNYHQEVDLRRVFADVAAYNEVIESPAQAPRLIADACRIAVAQRTVAHLNIPNDVSAARVPENGAGCAAGPLQGPAAAPAGSLDAAAALIDRSERIVILAGTGCRHAGAELARLAQRVGAPIVLSLRAKDLLAEDHPHVIGGLGLLGGRPAVEAMRNCDCLLIAGSDFPYRAFLPEDEIPTIQIDRDPVQIGRRRSVEAALCGDAASVLAALAERVSSRQRSFLKPLLESRDRWYAELAAQEDASTNPIKPQRLAHVLGELLDDEAIVACDTGEVTAWAARHLRMHGGGQRFILSSGLASMGFALPAAIGAQLSYPGRQTVALCGDGGFGMLMADFLTAVKYELPITVVVFNNGKLGLIQAEQESRGYPVSEVELQNPDFAAYARLCGGEGIAVHEVQALQDALRRALASSAPAVVDVHIDPAELPMPPRIALGQVAGYATAKLKELLGRGDAEGVPHG